MKEKVDAGDETAIECVGYGATVNPVVYLVNSSIDSDSWKDSSRWVEPKGTLKGKKFTRFTGQLILIEISIMPPFTVVLMIQVIFRYSNRRVSLNSLRGTFQTGTVGYFAGLA